MSLASNPLIQKCSQIQAVEVSIFRSNGYVLTCLLSPDGYISKKEWFLLNNFAKKISHPTIFDCELLSSVLGVSWSVRRVQNWFQHERNRSNHSKYDCSNLCVEDQSLWQQFLQIYTVGLDGQLLHQIQLVKQRAAILLSSTEVQKLWEEYDYKIKEFEPAILQTLKGVYANELHHNAPENEAMQLSELFQCNLVDIPALQVKQLRKVIHQQQNTAKVPDTVTIQQQPSIPVTKCQWEESSFCSCSPQNKDHVLFNEAELRASNKQQFYFQNNKSKFRSDYVFVDHLVDLATNQTFVDGAVIDIFLCHINSIINKPVYFMQAKILGLWPWNINYVKTKLDQDMMGNANEIFFPVHYHQQHWQLLQFDFANKKIVLYDGKRYVLIMKK